MDEAEAGPDAKNVAHVDEDDDESSQSLSEGEEKAAPAKPSTAQPPAPGGEAGAAE